MLSAPNRVLPGSAKPYDQLEQNRHIGSIKTPADTVRKYANILCCPQFYQRHWIITPYV